MIRKTLLAYGDSNTYGSKPRTPDAPRSRLTQPWPKVMAGDLGAPWEVAVDALPGRTTVHDDPVEGRVKNGFTPFFSILEQHQPLHVVVIMLGTNDLKARFGLSATRIAKGLARYVAVIRGSACGPGGDVPRILLVSPPPIQEIGGYAEMFQGGAARSRDLGDAIAAQADALGVPSFDAGSVIASSPVDGFHFDEPAHETLGRALAAKVREELQC